MIDFEKRLSKNKKKVIALACDGETTSFDKIGGDLIKWAFVEIYDDLTLGRKKAWSLRPYSTKYFTQGAQDIHGITYWQAQVFPKRCDALISMLNWLTPLKDQFQIPLIYHATGNFDPKWLEATFMKEEMQGSFSKAFHMDINISTLKLARKYLKQYKSHKLNICADHYKIELEHHEVLSDAVACAKIYCNIEKRIDVFTGELF